MNSEHAWRRSAILISNPQIHQWFLPEEPNHQLQHMITSEIVIMSINVLKLWFTLSVVSQERKMGPCHSRNSKKRQKDKRHEIGFMTLKSGRIKMNREYQSKRRKFIPIPFEVQHDMNTNNRSSLKAMMEANIWRALTKKELGEIMENVRECKFHSSDRKLDLIREWMKHVDPVENEKVAETEKLWLNAYHANGRELWAVTLDNYRNELSRRLYLQRNLGWSCQLVQENFGLSSIFCFPSHWMHVLCTLVNYKDEWKYELQIPPFLWFTGREQKKAVT